MPIFGSRNNALAQIMGRNRLAAQRAGVRSEHYDVRNPGQYEYENALAQSYGYAPERKTWGEAVNAFLDRGRNYYQGYAGTESEPLPSDWKMQVYLDLLKRGYRPVPPQDRSAVPVDFLQQ